jgi:hypothetical protein
LNYAALMQKKPRGRPPSPTSIHVLAEKCGVSERYLHYANELDRSGRDDLVTAVIRGEMKLPAAIRELRGVAGRPTRYDKLVTAWNLCSEEDQARFFVALAHAATRRATAVAGQASDDLAAETA